ADMSAFDREAILSTATCMPDKKADQKAMDYLKECMANCDSSGGVVECIVKGLPAGVGEPVFEKLDASLAKAIMSIGAVKAVEIGDGIQVSKATGSANNDAFVCKDGVISKKSNHAGGILGGVSDGSPIIIRAHIKPTPSIFQPQETINRNGENIEIKIKGRHDPVIVPRAVVVVEAMTALTLVDACMQNMTARLEYLADFYGRR
ncbi:MAG: chorismate synthase, partial [Clostridium sp.]|nr:chorismate synthase [Clostridium sp.]